jgi:GDP-4-dehydro-6-deoxy-D-mannose reductase
MRVLITGITGLVGSHLADMLLELGDYEIYGFKRWRADDRSIRHFGPSVRILEGDITDPHSVRAAVVDSRPDLVFHLAAQSYPSESWAAPTTTIETNVIGTVNVLEAVRGESPDARVQVAGSSAAYGFVPTEEMPISEARPLRPLSPYGVSKAAQEMLGHQYADSYSMAVVMTRSFNHIGTRQDSRTAAQTFARQIAEAEVGIRPRQIHVGNLEPLRDFLDVHDAVRAMKLVVEDGTPGSIYNVCSGRAVRIGDMLDMYLALGEGEFEVVVDEARLRPQDEPILHGDNAKIRNELGWAPQVPLATSLEQILGFWRDRVRQL